MLVIGPDRQRRAVLRTDEQERVHAERGMGGRKQWVLYRQFLDSMGRYYNGVVVDVQGTVELVRHKGQHVGMQ
jgi:hypothetical protein